MVHLRSTVASLSAIVSLAAAGGIIDNTAEAAAVAAAASTLGGSGSYFIENAATGQTISFVRQGGVTNFFPGGDASPVQIQFDGAAARISGGNNKCASAQFSYDVEGGVDHAAVSYACAVGAGPLTGTDTLEKPKQWWYLVPVDGGAPAPAPEATPEPAQEASDDVADTEDAKVLVAKPARGRRVKAAAAAAASDDSNGDFIQKTNGYWSTDSSSIPMHKVDKSGVTQDRNTWICRHPGWWLANHAGYVATHPECADDLAAFRADGKRRMKRATHAEIAFHKRDAQLFYIVPQDHILDMATRAFSSESKNTFGGYVSTTLSLWNKGDEHQMWSIVAA